MTGDSYVFVCHKKETNDALRVCMYVICLFVRSFVQFVVLGCPGQTEARTTYVDHVFCPVYDRTVCALYWLLLAMMTAPYIVFFKGQATPPD